MPERISRAKFRRRSSGGETLTAILMGERPTLRQERQSAAACRTTQAPTADMRPADSRIERNVAGAISPFSPSFQRNRASTLAIFPVSNVTFGW